MGTNYYLSYDIYTKCGHCGELNFDETEELHLGKSSGGWAFTLRQDPELGLWDWSTWKAFAKSKEDSCFYDEYGNDFTPDQMEAIVFRDGYKDCDWQHVAQDGIFGIGRHPTKPVDYVQGEFS